MVFFSRHQRRGLLAPVIAVLAMTANATLDGNPLATSDQRTLDALAIKINQDKSFPVLKAEAKAA